MIFSSNVQRQRTDAEELRPLVGLAVALICVLRSPKCDGCPFSSAGEVLELEAVAGECLKGRFGGVGRVKGHMRGFAP